MFEELIKKLQIQSTGFVSGDTIREAAAAIEEMNQCLDGISADNDSLCQKIDDLNKEVEQYKGFLDRYGGETGIKDMAEINNDLWNVLGAFRWISVKEQLPEEKTEVLVVCKNLSVFVAKYFTFYDEQIWTTAGPLGSGRRIATNRITHWMKLPQPPKEE